MLTPGPALDVATMISVQGSQARPTDSLYLTTVYSDMDITIAKWIQAQVGGNAQVLPKREFVPPSMSAEEYGQMIAEMMDESKVVSKIAALRHLGYDVKATGQGARVQKLLPGTMAQGILKEGDIVVAANDQTIQTAPDLVNLVRRQKPGESVSLRVLREGDPFEARVGTRGSDTEPGIAVIGIMIKTHLFGHDLPIQIDIDSENIGGPSAGLMFALGIVDALEAKRITAGHKVAGTGTISLDGSVGPVGGIEQKVMGAEQTEAEYFLAPRENVDLARRAARTIRVVEVGNLDDAIAFLRTLKPTAAAVAPPPLSLPPSLPAAATPR